MRAEQADDYDYVLFLSLIAREDNLILAWNRISRKPRRNPEPLNGLDTEPLNQERPILSDDSSTSALVPSTTEFHHESVEVMWSDTDRLRRSPA